ncbi:cyclopropane-fatty-acyl-phospholipid synthase family protein [Streptomyces sp. G-G2]|uniref:SAM-dependent methyltransferase n=1 Tax=Streptomyces sp. G-G2 TaxID=3046201 RepID=UPI0024BA9F8E|nr:cyclopropane-fatty-acyl-phospholipid synthase family protein [Streptomyces sp. G-G2]MDJ0381127.1 cyclopropane-fatty-acyl-phospholipid synthase family protein [Streptomyces sp. G-G2]
MPEVPRCSRARAAVGGALVRRALDRLPLTVRLGSGPGARILGRGGPDLVVRDPRAFVRRIATGGLIGFGESYQAGEWDAPDPVAVLTVLAGSVASLIPAPLQRLRGLWAPRHPETERNTRAGARSNIQRHYDLSNELFAEFLDPTMTYSSAVFGELPASWPELAAAQHRKIDMLLDSAGVGPGTRLLEIGTGWGELALRAAGRGADVVSLTLSREQRELAEQRIEAAGLSARAEVRLCDYREARGSYDAIVSVEMIEAVGVEYWPRYFAALDRLLAPGGRVALQAITMPHERMLATRSTYTWIHKYIFPGGMLPSVRAVEELARTRTRLRVERCEGYGAHYAQTLRLWRERFGERAERVGALGFDAAFQRMWTFYLAYSEAGFASGYLDVHHIVLAERDGEH